MTRYFILISSNIRLLCLEKQNEKLQAVVDQWLVIKTQHSKHDYQSIMEKLH